MIEGDEALELRQRRGSLRIAEAVRGVEFPATRADLVARLADIVLDVDSARLPVADLARGLPQGRFADARSAQKALEARWARIHENLVAVERAERSARSGEEE